MFLFLLMFFVYLIHILSNLPVAIVIVVVAWGQPAENVLTDRIFLNKFQVLRRHLRVCVVVLVCHTHYCHAEEPENEHGHIKG